MKLPWLYGSQAALLAARPTGGFAGHAAGLLCADAVLEENVPCLRSVTQFPDRAHWPDWSKPLPWTAPAGSFADLEDYAGYTRLPDGTRPASFWTTADPHISERAREFPAAGLLLPWFGDGYLPLAQYPAARTFVREFYRAHPAAVWVMEEALYPQPSPPAALKNQIKKVRTTYRPGAVWVLFWAQAGALTAESSGLWAAAAGADQRVLYVKA